MTKPTDEQIKALRKGDVVTVRAVVIDGVFAGGKLVSASFDRGSFGDMGVTVSTADIATIEPREIKVGDRVREGVYEGEVKAICEDTAFVRYDTVHGKDKPAFFCSEKLCQLERLT